MEPLESTSIHLVQSGIARLLQFLPREGISEVEAAEFNRQTDVEWTAIRDFIILHYKANNRKGAFWAACRQMSVPDTLAHRIELFRAGGRIFRVEEELFTEPGWLQVMLGQGIEPASYHPLADQLAAAQLGEFLALTRRHTEHVAGAMPDHAAFIARHCAIPAEPRPAQAARAV
jgi:tryptophan halogenase